MGCSDFVVSGRDKLTRTFVLPKRILWAGSGVLGGEMLLSTDAVQSCVSPGSAAVLSNRESKRGAVLLDFGSELVGGVELITRRGGGGHGSGLHIRFGESAAEAMTELGKKNAGNDHGVRDMTVPLSFFSQQSFGNTGFRFVLLEMVGAESWLELAAVRGVLTVRDIPYLGSFSCSDPQLDRIYDVSAYTVHLCMQNMLWDGVKRDRLVWVGDMHPEMLAIRSVFGEQSIVDDALRFVAGADPLPRWPNSMTTYGLWYLLILWDWYRYTGDRKLAQELRTYWVGLTCRLLALVHTDAQVLDEAEFQTGFFVDWPTKDTPPARAGVHALFRLAMLAAEQLCSLVGETKLAARCAEASELLRVTDLDCGGKKQIAALMHMAGMMPDGQAARILTEGCGQGMSTFMSYYILSAVADTAGIEQALAMLGQYYGAMLDAQATTFWEDFDLEWMRPGAAVDQVLRPGEYDIHGDNGRFCYEGMRHSLCHGWSAGPAAFLAERVLGIRILSPGCTKLEIKPELGALSWAKGTYPTPLGVVAVEARREGGRTVVAVTAPDGTEIVK